MYRVDRDRVSISELISAAAAVRRRPMSYSNLKPDRRSGEIDSRESWLSIEYVLNDKTM